LALSWFGFRPSKNNEIKTVLTFVETESPVKRLYQIFAHRGLISFKSWQNILKLLFLDHKQVISDNALDHREMDKGQDILG
jgi:hypothetical protein